jgi:pyruvate/2-oxoglutarate dehydrogenase complex dihydrolipoamide dehydrogenase (E3) component
MAESERVEVLILGSGQGGKLLAWHMAQSGPRTAVVERRSVGGSWPNIACMPSKNEIWSARVAHLARHAADFGTATCVVTTDMSCVRQRKREMVEREVAFHLERYKSTGVELIMGSGRFVAPKTLEVHTNEGTKRVLTADQVFLNVGSHAAIPDITGLEAANPLTHIEALELDHLPDHLVVLGGGYVGLELAQAYRRSGSRVSVIHDGPRIMSREDADVADEIERMLTVEGIEFLLATETLTVRGRSADKIVLRLRTVPANTRSRPATSSSPQGASPTPPASGWRRLGSN